MQNERITEADVGMNHLAKVHVDRARRERAKTIAYGLRKIWAWIRSKGGQFTRWITLKQREQQTIQELARLDARELRDVGIDPNNLEAEVHMLIWQTNGQDSEKTPTTAIDTENRQTDHLGRAA